MARSSMPSRSGRDRRRLKIARFQGTGKDLVEGSRGSYFATLVERQSHFVILVKLADKRTETVVPALIKAIRTLPVALRRSLTWDRGAELANHAQFTIATDVQVYFCDPSSPW